jgi:hypothetical protein
MPETAQPPTPLRAAASTPTESLTAATYAWPAAYEGLGQGTKPQRRRQHTGVTDKSR